MLADEIRKDITVEKLFQEVPELKKSILEYCKSCGHSEIICDNHIYENGSYKIMPKYEKCLTDWAKKEGFDVSYTFNSYGVRYLKISI